MYCIIVRAQAEVYLCLRVAAARKRRRRFSSGDEVISAYGAKPPLSALDRRCLELYVRHGFRCGWLAGTQTSDRSRLPRPARLQPR